jgi:hypothetical protein
MDTSSSVPAHSDGKDAETLLASANLARMRRRWLEAESLCVEVMRQDPNNIHAHSLLGDIYRDQNRLHDARQWYQMALDLNPDSAADRAKLTEIERMEARFSGADALPTPPAPPLSDQVGTQKLLGVSPVAWVRGLTVVSVVFALAAFALIAYLWRNPAGKPPVPTGTVAMRPSGSPGPQGTIPMPNMTPPSTALPPANLPPPGLNRSLPAPPVSPPGAPEETMTDQEIGIRDHIHRQGVLSPETSVSLVTVDPNQQSVSLTLTRVQRGPVTSMAILRDTIVRDSIQASQALFYAGSQFQRVRISYRISIDSNRPIPLFSGDLDRATAQNIQGSMDTDQLANLFTNPQWAQGLAPRTTLPPMPGENDPNVPDSYQ